MNAPALLLALRPTQWLKNLILFAAITFSGELFNPILFRETLYGFIAFCLLSSASYLLNDVKDLEYDRKHPAKRNRPIAKGLISVRTAVITAFLLIIAGLSIASSLSNAFFFISMAFVAVQFAYTFWLKRFAVFDILMIALTFTLRAFAGEVITSFHIPIWLMLTVIFLSLFIASSKRHSELLRMGNVSRPALLSYRERLLDFYATTSATATLLSYALFVFFEEPPTFNRFTQELLTFTFPTILQRKWLILTFPFVLLGVMRYAQIVYEKRGGEMPERLITRDLVLLFIIFGWGIMIITIIYLL